MPPQKQTNKQTNNKQTNKQTDKHINKQKTKQASKQSKTKTNKQKQTNTQKTNKKQKRTNEWTTERTNKQTKQTKQSNQTKQTNNQPTNLKSLRLMPPTPFLFLLSGRSGGGAFVSRMRLLACCVAALLLCRFAFSFSRGCACLPGASFLYYWPHGCFPREQTKLPEVLRRKERPAWRKEGARLWPNGLRTSNVARGYLTAFKYGVCPLLF